MKIVRSSLFAILISLIFSNGGCVPPNVVKGGFDAFQLKKIDLKTETGKELSAEVGESVYQSGSSEEIVITRATLDTMAEGRLEMLRSVSLPAGFTGRLMTRDTDGAKVLCPKLIESPEGGVTYQRYDECLVDANNDGLFEAAMFPQYEKYFPLTKSATYKTTTIKRNRANNVKHGDAFKQEIIYQGFSSNTLRLSYREFVDDMARPAFTQELTYEHKNGQPTLVGFKGLRMKVLDANNTKVNYIIEQGLDSTSNK